MKIALLNIYNGKVERGSEVFVDRIATELGKKHQVTVFQTGKKRQHSYRVITVNAVPFMSHQAHWFTAHVYPFVTAWFTLRTLPALFGGQYDWIIPINGGWQVLLCRLVRFFRASKILISGHAGIGGDDRWNLLFGKPNVFVALTPAAYTWANEMRTVSHVVYIPNGVNDHLFSPKGAVAKVDLQTPIILCVAALVAYKRIDLLIDAVAHTPQTSLLLIGDGPLRTSLTEKGVQALGSRFSHIPHAAHEAMPQYYRTAQVFSLPSKGHEAFGLVYLEAMSCNIPVVAPDDENRRVLVGTGGILTAVEDAPTYAQSLALAIQKDWGTAPREQSQKYTWQYISDQYEKTMERFLPL